MPYKTVIRLIGVARNPANGFPARLLVLGPGPEAARRRLYNLSQAHDGVPRGSMRRTQKLSPTFHTLYSRTLLGKEGSSRPDYHRGRQQVEDAVAAFFDSDYWGLVNAVRGEFGLPSSSLEGQVPAP